MIRFWIANAAGVISVLDDLCPVIRMFLAWTGQIGGKDATGAEVFLRDIEDAQRNQAPQQFKTPRETVAGLNQKSSQTQSGSTRGRAGDPNAAPSTAEAERAVAEWKATNQQVPDKLPR